MIQKQLFSLIKNSHTITNHKTHHTSGTQVVALGNGRQSPFDATLGSVTLQQETSHKKPITDF